MDGGPSVASVPGSSSVLSGGTAPEDEGAAAPLTTGVHLQLLFQYYCRFGRSGTDHDIDTLDNAMYAKFTRDCPGLLARPLGAAECDLLFLKHKAKALRRATYGQVRASTRALEPAPPSPHTAHPRAPAPPTRAAASAVAGHPL